MTMRMRQIVEHDTTERLNADFYSEISLFTLQLKFDARIEIFLLKAGSKFGCQPEFFCFKHFLQSVM